MQEHKDIGNLEFLIYTYIYIYIYSKNSKQDGMGPRTRQSVGT
jgi:hypothetical protein